MGRVTRELRPVMEELGFKPWGSLPNTWCLRLARFTLLRLWSCGGRWYWSVGIGAYSIKSGADFRERALRLIDAFKGIGK